MKKLIILITLFVVLVVALLVADPNEISVEPDFTTTYAKVDLNTVEITYKMTVSKTDLLKRKAGLETDKARWQEQVDLCQTELDEVNLQLDLLI